MKGMKFEALREPSLRDASGNTGQPHGAMGATMKGEQRRALSAVFMRFMLFMVQTRAAGKPVFLPVPVWRFRALLQIANAEIGGPRGAKGGVDGGTVRRGP